MSKVALIGNASGTGTFTIASPNSNTDRTLSLPDASGTILTTATAGVPVGGMAFSAYQSVTQNISTATATKLTFTTVEFSAAGGSFANSIFTPSVAGYYQISAGVAWNSGASNTNQILLLYKNGTSYKSVYGGSNTTAGGGCSMSDVIYLNGSTDYVEIYAIQQSGSTLSTFAGTRSTYFSAFLARSAT